jgi:hypothetical protein
MSDMIINKVANSGLITLNLESYLPEKPIAGFDLKDHLFMGLILKEKDFREALKAKNWDEYKDQYVAVYCSVDAVIPVWAFMLVVSYLQPVVKDVFLGSETEFYKHLVLKNIDAVDTKEFADQRIVIKGCGEIAIDNYAYAEITKKLLPVSKSIMYGEPCSTVPVYKKRP